MPQNVLLKVHGLNSFVNQLSEAPSGSLQQADNVVVTRDGVIEPCRGFKIYGNAMGVSTTTLAKQLMNYKLRILRHYSNKLEFDNGSGTFTAFSGNYLETETGLRIKSLEANGNFYFTTSTGIKKISVSDASQFPTTSITDAGGIKALDVRLFLNSDPGFFTENSVVAYRIVWGIKDSNNNLILGAPSQREVITNPGETLLTSDFNTLLSDLDTAAPLSLTDDLSDTDYSASYNITMPSATTLQTNMSALCTKLDTDLGGTPFSSIKSDIDAITISSPATAGELQQLEEQYNAIVDLLNSFIGSVGSPTITSLASAFTNSTQSSTVNLEITIPESVTTANFYQVYRTAVVQATGTSVLADIDPGDEMGLVFEGNPTSAEISAGFLTLTDITPEAFRGANLYTNPNSGEGIAQANEVPPKAKDIVSFKNYTFYANTETKYRKNFSLLSVSDLTPDVSKITITNGTISNTYTFSTSEDVATKKVLISTLETPGQEVDETARSLVHVINRQDNEIVYAYYLSGPTDIPGMILFESRTLGDGIFYVTVDSTTTGSQFSPVIPEEHTITANTSTNPTVVTSVSHGLSSGQQIIIRDSDSVPVINGAYTVTVIDADTFSIPVNVTVDGTTGIFALATFVGDNEVAPNRIYYSKQFQPEAVPLLNNFDVGPKDRKIIRIVALRESLFVFKEEGIYRVSGDTAPFVLNLFDSSTNIGPPDTAEVLNNQIYLLSSQGVATVSDTGVSIISRPIENLLTKLNTPNYPNYKTASFGKSYESDRTYYLWTVTRTTDTIATQCFKYNTFTNAWYRSPTSKTCSVINFADDKMYLGAGDTNFIEQERKNFDRTDFADREYEQVLSSSSVSGDLITLPSVLNVSERDVLVQVQYLTISQLNRVLNKLDSDLAVNDSDYFSTLGASSGDNLRDILTSLATKLDNDSGVSDSNYASTISSYTSSFSDTQLAFNVIVNKLNSDTGVTFSNYPLSTGTTSFESIILSVNTKTNVIQVESSDYPFVEGPITTYAHINSEFTWHPQTFGDPSVLKQVADATMIFEKTNFSKLIISFSSDISPGFEEVVFNGSGNGIYGNGIYGEETYGGLGSSAPFRTFVPRNKARCRYINCKIKHGTAREAFALYGLSLTGNITSTRAYR